MKIILINAPVEKIVEEYDAPKYPHIGLAYLATYANKNGLDVSVIDCKFERLTIGDLIVRLQTCKDKDLVVGLTAMTHEIVRNAFVARELKKNFPGIKIIIGGVHVSALPEETLKEFNTFDLGIVGEGEKTFVELVESLKGKNVLRDVKGIVYREGNKILLTEERGWIEDLDEIGYPDWELFPRAKEYPINIGRGCPVPCIFCMRASGKKSRYRSAKNILEELEVLNTRYTATMVHFFGDDFAADKNLTEQILDGLIKMRPVFQWRAGMRVSNINKDLLEKMKKANCEHFEFGVESGNKEILKIIKKGIVLEKVEEVIKLSKEVGLDCWCYFILGHPNENWNTAMDTLNFLRKINPKNAAVGIMVPYPGTEVWSMALKGEGGYKLLSRNWQDYNKQIGNALELAELSRRQLEFLQMYAYIKLFLFNLRLGEFLEFCWHYRREGMSFLRNYFIKSLRLQKH
ncbi:MAG: radical SAM protein [Candidatus Omnitrophica bacterium]|nr:radical SAM protein [Candidatus Omnitrophota bacterium]